MTISIRLVCILIDTTVWAALLQRSHLTVASLSSACFGSLARSSLKGFCSIEGLLLLSLVCLTSVKTACSMEDSLLCIKKL